jgi:hypothetical protein
LSATIHGRTGEDLKLFQLEEQNRFVPTEDQLQGLDSP